MYPGRGENGTEEGVGRVRVNVRAQLRVQSQQAFRKKGIRVQVRVQLK